MGGRGAMTARRQNQEKPKCSFHFSIFLLILFLSPAIHLEKQGQTEWIGSMGKDIGLFSIRVNVNVEVNDTQSSAFIL